MRHSRGPRHGNAMETIRPREGISGQHTSCHHWCCIVRRFAEIYGIPPNRRHLSLLVFLGTTVSNHGFNGEGVGRAAYRGPLVWTTVPAQPSLDHVTWRDEWTLATYTAFVWFFWNESRAFIYLFMFLFIHLFIFIICLNVYLHLQKG